MAIGDVTDYPDGSAKAIVLLAAVTAANSPPSGASAGLDMIALQNLYGYMPEEVTLIVRSTAGSDTMTATCRLWAYQPGAADWFPIGPGTAALKGTINQQAAIEETAADELRHQEVLDMAQILGSRLYLEVVSIGGTSTAVMAELLVRRRS